MKPEDEARLLLKMFAGTFTEPPCGGPKTKKWARKLWSAGRRLLGKGRKPKAKIAPPVILRAISNIANYLYDDEYEDFQVQVQEGNEGGVEHHVFRDVIRVLFWLKPDRKYPGPNGWRQYLKEVYGDALEDLDPEEEEEEEEEDDGE